MFLLWSQILLYSDRNIELYTRLFGKMLIRCVEKLSLLSKVISSTFSFFAILIVTLLDMRCLSLTPNSIKEHLSELRTITFYRSGWAK